MAAPLQTWGLSWAGGLREGGPGSGAVMDCEAPPFCTPGDFIRITSAALHIIEGEWLYSTTEAHVGNESKKGQELCLADVCMQVSTARQDVSVVLVHAQVGANLNLGTSASISCFFPHCCCSSPCHFCPPAICKQPKPHSESFLPSHPSCDDRLGCEPTGRGGQVRGCLHPHGDAGGKFLNWGPGKWVAVSGGQESAIGCVMAQCSKVKVNTSACTEQTGNGFVSEFC